jgi:membrane protein required for colicin V production
MVWLDWVILLVLAVSAVIGAVRGLVFELLSMLGWLVAWVCAGLFGGMAATAMHLDFHSIGLNRGIGFVLVFVVVLIVWRLLVALIRTLVHASPLGLLDHGLGALFGTIRGCTMAMALVYLLGLTPLGRQPVWKHSVGVQWSQGAIAWLLPRSAQVAVPVSGHQV